MNCLNCSMWNLRDSPLRAHGFGQCRANPKPGHTLSGMNVCRFGKFSQAEAVVVERRQKESAGAL